MYAHFRESKAATAALKESIMMSLDAADLITLEEALILLYFVSKSSFFNNYYFNEAKFNLIFSIDEPVAIEEKIEKRMLKNMIDRCNELLLTHLKGLAYLAYAQVLAKSGKISKLIYKNGVFTF